MNKIILFVLLLWGTHSFAGIKSAEIIASGLTCSMCSKSIYKALEKVPFIQSVDANVEKSSFSIRFKDGMPVSLDEVKAAVEKAGFSVASMIATVSFNGQDVQNDTHLNVSGNTFHFLGISPKKLQGDVAIRVVDKNFLPIKEHKKYSKHTAMKCFNTGVKTVCCPKDAQNRVYHVTI